MPYGKIDVSRRSFVLAGAGVAGALAASLAARAAFAAGGKEEAAAPEKADAKEGVVVDSKDREVAVPEKVERVGVTCMGGATQMVCALGAADRLVMGPSMEKAAPLLLKMFPQLADLPDAGTFDDVNVETLAAAEPDLVFVSSTSDKGNQKIDDLGIPTYTLGTANSTVASMRNDYVNAGVLLGATDVADDLMAFWDETMDFVDKAAASIPDGERLTVYRCGAQLTAANHTPWASTWIEAAGGVSVAEKGTTGDVSIEQIAEWDPDVIITSAPVASILEEEAYKDLKAVKNGAVYNTPKGAMGWDVPSPEVPLGFAWLGQLLYPAAFEGLDVEEETKAFYAKFFGYELDADDLDTMFRRK